MPRNCIYNDIVARDHQYLNIELKNKNRYRQLMNMNQMSINNVVRPNIIVGSEFQRIDISQKQFLIVQFDHQYDEVAFHLTCTLLDDVALNEKPSIRMHVWRSSKYRHQGMFGAMTDQVLLEYLLDRYNLIASDNHNTLLGRQYWTDTASYILERRLYVYRYNRLTRSIKEIVNHEELVTNNCDLWG